MKSLLITPLVLLALLASLHAGADFYKGMAAADAGDYATAEKEWKKAAEQGDARALARARCSCILWHASWLDPACCHRYKYFATASRELQSLSSHCQVTSEQLAPERTRRCTPRRAWPVAGFVASF